MIETKYIEYIIILTIIILFIYYTFYEIDKEIIESIPEKIINPIPYLTPEIIVKKSNIKGGGRGVFSTRSYNTGDFIEVCPCIKQEAKYIKGNLSKYVFSYNRKYSIIALGFCSIYNHKDEPNAKWYIVNRDQMKIVALKNIQPGEEIFISYGPYYFKDHGLKMK